MCEWWGYLDVLRELLRAVGAARHAGDLRVGREVEQPNPRAAAALHVRRLRTRRPRLSDPSVVAGVPGLGWRTAMVSMESGREGGKNLSGWRRSDPATLITTTSGPEPPAHSGDEHSVERLTSDAASSHAPCAMLIRTTV